MKGEVFLACWIGKTCMSSKAWSGWEEVYPRPRCRVPNAVGESATIAAVVYSCGVPIPTSSPGVWWWSVLGWLSNRKIGSSTLMSPGAVRFGGLTVPRGDDWAGVAGRVGRGLRGDGVRRPPSRHPVEGEVGKSSVCSSVRRHVACITGLRV
jgi:hypothetical protein